MHHEFEAQKTFDNLKHSLQTSPTIRTLKQIKSIQSYMSSLLFFRNNIIPMGDDIIYKVCSIMEYEHFYPNQYICKIGEPGDKFYIILKGIVKILVNSPQDDTEEYEANRLSEGASFGEYSLLHNQPRIASIQCLTDTELVVLTKNHYLNILGKIEAKRVDEQVKFLRRFTIFAKWSKNLIIKVNYFLKEKTLPRKSIIFREGDKANEIIFIKSGELEICKSVRTPTQKKVCYLRYFPPQQNADVAILGPGETVGEELMYSDKHLYTCKVYSYTATIMVMDKDEFFKRVRNEDSQNALISANEVREKVRNMRVKSLIMLKNKNYQDVEEKNNASFERLKTRKRQSVSVKSPVVTPTKKVSRYKVLNHVDIQNIVSRSKIDILSPVANQVFNIKKQKSKSPFGGRVYDKVSEKHYLWPIKIEQKKIYDRAKAFMIRRQSSESEFNISGYRV
ncbi:hypothetical protein SteCoe_18703 [Stentor coeruleus]|uniref:Cyclic nucleotide-binding domain-containing protein n=1 Tax=Stentor coeruleus TaxID=5963 RepID=A0A1R2BW67_9CILI|nr:hypothetical protein SteCoe_18703 [Stentor coeruleus]